MKKKLLLSGERRQYMVKDIAVFDNPERLKAVLNKLTWRILQLLSEKEMYPMEIARKLGVHEQNVYYHIRKLSRAGAVKIVKRSRTSQLPT
jgi:predicted transcriptional regulator